jgi:hypothetical protein
VEAEVLVSNDEFEAAHCNVTGKSADGKDVNFSGIVVARFEDGKIMEGWDAFNFLSTYKQLGQNSLQKKRPLHINWIQTKRDLLYIRIAHMR